MNAKVGLRLSCSSCDASPIPSSVVLVVGTTSVPPAVDGTSTVPVSCTSVDAPVPSVASGSAAVVDGSRLARGSVDTASSEGPDVATVDVNNRSLEVEVNNGVVEVDHGMGVDEEVDKGSVEKAGTVVGMDAEGVAATGAEVDIKVEVAVVLEKVVLASTVSVVASCAIGSVEKLSSLLEVVVVVLISMGLVGTGPVLLYVGTHAAGLIRPPHSDNGNMSSLLHMLLPTWQHRNFFTDG